MRRMSSIQRTWSSTSAASTRHTALGPAGSAANASMSADRLAPSSFFLPTVSGCCGLVLLCTKRISIGVPAPSTTRLIMDTEEHASSHRVQSSYRTMAPERSRIGRTRSDRVIVALLSSTTNR
jgi:hypothetical protein